MAGIVRFDCYEVDLGAGQISKRGRTLRLRDQPFRVLAALLEQPGQVVTREALRHRLWPGEVFVDFDNVLNTAVGRLRETLGDWRIIPASSKHYRSTATVSSRR